MSEKTVWSDVNRMDAEDVREELDAMSERERVLIDRLLAVSVREQLLKLITPLCLPYEYTATPQDVGREVPGAGKVTSEDVATGQRMILDEVGNKITAKRIVIPPAPKSPEPAHICNTCAYAVNNGTHRVSLWCENPNSIQHEKAVVMRGTCKHWSDEDR